MARLIMIALVVLVTVAYVSAWSCSGTQLMCSTYESNIAKTCPCVSGKPCPNNPCTPSTTTAATTTTTTTTTAATTTAAATTAAATSGTTSAAQTQTFQWCVEPFLYWVMSGTCASPIGGTFSLSTILASLEQAVSAFLTFTTVGTLLLG